MAEYTPSSDEDWETSYKAYAKSVEETYPPACERCEAEVRNKMKASDYFVSADNLYRSIKSPKDSWIIRRGWQYDLASLALVLGKYMWFISWIGQLLWHVMGIVKPMRYPQCISEFAPEPSLTGCAEQVLTLTAFDEFCDDLLGTLIGWALVLGLLSIWWNPMWVKKMNIIYGRIAGGTEYYQLQGIFLGLRWAGWNFITQPEPFELEPQQWKALHAFMLLVTLLVSTIQRLYRHCS